eukprot:GHVL01036462.1.p1 GENE.GHVL01036462.1~~GHVL01036462.1.p1  ORF type:complete len:146 (-),score=7.83 GHVL01036462.1:1204-1641(-)
MVSDDRIYITRHKDLTVEELNDLFDQEMDTFKKVENEHTVDRPSREYQQSNKQRFYEDPADKKLSFRLFCSFVDMSPLFKVMFFVGSAMTIFLMFAPSKRIYGSRNEPMLRYDSFGRAYRYSRRSGWIRSFDNDKRDEYANKKAN